MGLIHQLNRLRIAQGGALTLGAEKTFTASITNFDDDAEERQNGTMINSSDDLEIGTTGSYDQSVGLRFRNVTIPKFGTAEGEVGQVTEVTIIGTAKHTKTAGTVETTIYGFDEDNTGVFTTTAYDMTGRAKTTASVFWDLTGSSWTAGDRTAAQTTPDLKAIVEEILSRSGWSSGNALGFIFEFDASSTDFRSYAGHSHATYDPATITIKYKEWEATTNDSIQATGPVLYLNPDTIDPAVTTDGASITTWNDASGNNFNASVGAGAYELNISSGGVRETQQNVGVSSWWDIPDNALLDFTPGTDEFTVIFRIGEVFTSVDDGYFISKATGSTSTRMFGIYADGTGNFGPLYCGGSTTSFSTITAPAANQLIIAVIQTSQADVWIDGTQVITAGAVGTADSAGQSWNIGGRTDGSYVFNDTVSFSLAAIIPKAISASERAAIESEFQIN